MPSTPLPITVHDRIAVRAVIQKFDDRNKRNPRLSEIVKDSPYTKTFLQRVVKSMLQNGELLSERLGEDDSPLSLGSYPK